MKPRLLGFLLTLSALGASIGAAHAREPSNQPLPSVPQRVYANTTEVESMALDGTSLWVATRGGLEQYDTESLQRTAHYTTLDGLPSLFVQSVKVERGGAVMLQSHGQRCVLGASQGPRRITCGPRSRVELRCHESLGTANPREPGGRAV